MNRDIAEAIRLILRHELPDSSPEEVNDGNCEWFANRVVELCPFARVVWDDLITHGTEGGSHCFVEYNGWFYDSETPGGVSDWGRLPFFIRERRLQWLNYQFRTKDS